MARRLLLLALTIVVLAVGFVAGYSISRSSQPPTEERRVPVVAVDNGSVGRSITFNAEVRSNSRLAATNVLTGVVTSVSTENQFDIGDVVYSVNDIPVFVTRGDVPFYRDLREGVRGRDVEQLNAMLAHLGYPVTVDDSFGPVTRAGVTQWQKDTGQPATGEVTQGQLIAVHSLPSALVLDTDALTPAAVLSGGEQLVAIPDGTPRVVVVLSESQTKLLSPGLPVSLTQDGQEWTGVIGETTSNDDTNTFEVEIVAETGGPICSDPCPSPGPNSSAVASIELVPTVAGPVIPRSAIMTDSVGASYVVTEDGEKRDITVMGASDGVAVVEGVEQGESVRVFGDED